jgi:NAD(P)-dependent dehydrogenase (short-subunit alcohol dehydrogenase family)
MTSSPDLQSLRGRVAVVAGATRGAGRGIAAALGERARPSSVRGAARGGQGSSRSDYKRPETIDGTAELVTRLGGNGIAMAVDHLNSGEVKRLADDCSWK